MIIDGDPRRSASHANLIAHLAGPYRGGAVATPIPLAGTLGDTAAVEAGSRWPLLLVGTRRAVGPRGFDATVVVTPRDGGPVETATVRFAAFTEAGACLPVWRSAAEVAPGLDCALSVDAPGGESPLELLELELVEGVLGRLLYVIGAEKARVRRQARELFELRRLDFPIAADDDRDHRRLGPALDRLGADLGVPRFADRLAWDATAREVATIAEREPNRHYRERLAMMRRFLLPTRGRIEHALAAFVPPGRFAINEANTDLAVAIRLLSSPDDTARVQFLAHLRAAYLVQPGEPIPATRALPTRTRASLQHVLDRVGAAFELPGGAFMAPLLAEALDRVGRCRVALGVARRWKLVRAQDDAGGSRHELGLGVEVEPLPPAELDLMVDNLGAGTFAAGTDAETLALLGSLTAAPRAADPIGRWLLAGAGLRTVQPVAGGGLYLSHFPAFGTVLSGAPAALEARFHAPGDPGPHAALVFALVDVATRAAAAGLPPSTELASGAAAAAIAAATLPAGPAIAAFTRAGLRTPEDADNLARAKAELAAFAPEQLAVLALDGALAAGVLANDEQAVTRLQQLIAILRAAEVISVLPLVTGGGVVLVVSIASLPASAARLNSARHGFRWYVLPIDGVAGALAHRVGARNRYTAPTTPSLAAVVVVTMARRDRADPRDAIPPYQVRVQMPAGDLLDLDGYERLMNLLRRAVPIGVVVDTSPVREGHVDPAGDGHAVPFRGRLTHQFRTYEQRRHRGAVDQDSEP